MVETAFLAEVASIPTKRHQLLIQHSLILLSTFKLDAVLHDAHQESGDCTRSNVNLKRQVNAEGISLAAACEFSYLRNTFTSNKTCTDRALLQGLSRETQADYCLNRAIGAHT